MEYMYCDDALEVNFGQQCHLYTLLSKSVGHDLLMLTELSEVLCLRETVD